MSLLEKLLEGEEVRLPAAVCPRRPVSLAVAHVAIPFDSIPRVRWVHCFAAAGHVLADARGPSLGHVGTICSTRSTGTNPRMIGAHATCMITRFSHYASHRSAPLVQLETESQLQLPLWLVRSLVERRHVEVQLPKCYGNVWRNALKANASHQNLSSQSEYYFDVGVQLSQLVEEGDLGVQLLTGFASRFEGLLDAALNVTDKVDATALKEKLTLREKQLFDAGRDASQQWQRWKTERTRSRIEQADLVTKAKRARAQ